MSDLDAKTHAEEERFPFEGTDAEFLAALSERPWRYAHRAGVRLEAALSQPPSAIVGREEVARLCWEMENGEGSFDGLGANTVYRALALQTADAILALLSQPPQDAREDQVRREERERAAKAVAMVWERNGALPWEALDKHNRVIAFEEADAVIAVIRSEQGEGER